MSRAFVKDSDDQEWLDEIPSTMNALIAYLTKDNNGIQVYEQKNYVHPANGKEIHEMSNGLSYTLNDEGKWQVILD